MGIFKTIPKLYRFPGTINLELMYTSPESSLRSNMVLPCRDSRCGGLSGEQVAAGQMVRLDLQQRRLVLQTYRHDLRAA